MTLLLESFFTLYVITVLCNTQVHQVVVVRYIQQATCLFNRGKNSPKSLRSHLYYSFGISFFSLLVFNKFKKSSLVFYLWKKKHADTKLLLVLKTSICIIIHTNYTLSRKLLQLIKLITSKTKIYALTLQRITLRFWESFILNY